MERFIRIDSSGNGVATIRIDRPKANAMNLQVVAELIEATAELGASTDVRAVVIWGGPKIFCGGADIGGFQRPPSGSLADLAHAVTSCVTAVENLPQITVAAVTGAALGSGLELALAADFRVAAHNAILGHPEIHLGLIPGAGAAHRLPLLVGLTKAKEMFYSGEPVHAQEALDIGLVSAVHPPEETYAKAMEMASKYASGPAALQMAKRALMDGVWFPDSEDLATQVEHLMTSFATDDATIGLSSFLEKGPGKAVFTGR